MKYKYFAILHEHAVVNDFEYPRSFEVIVTADDDVRARKYVEFIVPTEYKIILKEAHETSR